MLRCVPLVRTDISEERIAPIIRVTRMGELGTTTNVVPSSPILVALMVEALSSSETAVLTRATRRNIPEDTILHSHRRENLKSYTLNSNYVSGRGSFQNIFVTLRNCFVLSASPATLPKADAMLVDYVGPRCRNFAQSRTAASPLILGISARTQLDKAVFAISPYL
jgi:hypothetical protein